MALTLQRFNHENVNLICDYIESIKEFDEITAVIPKDRAVCEEKLYAMLESGEGVGVVVFDSEWEKIVGIGIAAKVELWWTSEKVWNNVLFYVAPEYRASRATLLLKNFFKKLSDMTSSTLYFDVISGGETNFPVYDKVFKHMGFTKIGSSFIYKKAA